MNNTEKKQVERKDIYYYDSGKEPLYELILNAKFDNEEVETEISIDNLPKVVDKINQLYISYRREFYITSNDILNEGDKYRKESEKSLNDSMVKNHLNLQHTIYCYPMSDISSKWFAFRINSKKKGSEKIEDIKLNTKRLIMTLSKYIPKEYIHCYRDGIGSYNIIVHLENFEYRDKIYKFQEHIRRLSGICKTDNDITVNVSPKKGYLKDFKETLMLPLGRNFLNSNNETNYCCFVQLDTLVPIISQYKYFLKIKRLPSDIFYNKTMLTTRHYNQMVNKRKR